MTAPRKLANLAAVLGGPDVTPSAAESVRCPSCLTGWTYYETGVYGQTVERCGCGYAATITRRVVIAPDAPGAEPAPRPCLDCGDPVPRNPNVVTKQTARYCPTCRHRRRQGAGRLGRAAHPTSVAFAARQRRKGIAADLGGGPPVPPASKVGTCACGCGRPTIPTYRPQHGWSPPPKSATPECARIVRAAAQRARWRRERAA